MNRPIRAEDGYYIDGLDYDDLEYKVGADPITVNQYSTSISSAYYLVSQYSRSHVVVSNHIYKMNRNPNSKAGKEDEE